MNNEIWDRLRGGLKDIDRHLNRLETNVDICNILQNYHSLKWLVWDYINVSPSNISFVVRS